MCYPISFSKEFNDYKYLLFRVYIYMYLNDFNVHFANIYHSKHVPLENKSKSIILYILHKEPTVLSSFFKTLTLSRCCFVMGVIKSATPSASTQSCGRSLTRSGTVPPVDRYITVYSTYIHTLILVLLLCFTNCVQLGLNNIIVYLFHCICTCT